MERRDFFRILSAASAGAIAGGCGNKADKLIPMLVPAHEIVPGEEQWHPAVCTGCAAGCGMIARVMEGVRTVERDGEQVRERIAAIKKLEGNPLDPVSGGHLCARGQAGVQMLYHPDRLRGPMKRSGDRGKAQFAAVSWDEAIGWAAERIAKMRAADPESIVFLTGPCRGSRSLAIERFMQALNSPPPVVCSLADFAIERKAAEMVFGWKGLPVYDLAQAHYALGVGADFLGGWASPVYYSRQFGDFRQGRTNIRGYLVQAESRLSITAAAADRWLPLRPGTEPQFLAAVGRLLLDADPARGKGVLPAAVLAKFQSVDVGGALESCGLEDRRVRPIVRELAASEAPLVIAGSSVVQSNSLDAVAASHYVNLLLGNVGKRGGVLAPPPTSMSTTQSRNLSDTLAHARVVFIDGANPVYTLPGSGGARDTLARAELVISFASFLDDSGAWSDLLLPDHHPLESSLAVVPVVAPRPAVSVSMAFVEPLYDTRAVERTLADLARKMDLNYTTATLKDAVEPQLHDGATLDDVARAGGFWGDANPQTPVKPQPVEFEFRGPTTQGDPAEFPLEFQPHLSLQFHDGSGASSPWLQELPDPTSSAIWGLPVEIDPKTAADLKINTGDRVRVESRHGSIEAPAYVHPGAIPGVVSMAIGDGHTHYGRYASDRGANPISILAPAWEKATGVLVLGGTRVKMSRVGASRSLIQFSTQDRQERSFDRR
jgi:anaerobic selenocysteine-containing dehydrogenase